MQISKPFFHWNSFCIHLVLSARIKYFTGRGPSRPPNQANTSRALRGPAGPARSGPTPGASLNSILTGLIIEIPLYLKKSHYCSWSAILPPKPSDKKQTSTEYTQTMLHTSTKFSILLLILVQVIMIKLQHLVASNGGCTQIRSSNWPTNGAYGHNYNSSWNSNSSLPS